MRTIKVSESDFDIREYSLRVVCPYCKKIIFFYEYEKYIDKIDCCPNPNCGKELHIVTKEKRMKITTEKERMAEEYEEEAECVEVNDYGQKVYGSMNIEQAWLAGFEAGRPKWHKVTDGDLPNENVKLILVRDRWKNHFLNYHLLLTKMIVEMIDQFDEWVELPTRNEHDRKY